MEGGVFTYSVLVQENRGFPDVKKKTCLSAEPISILVKAHPPDVSCRGANVSHVDDVLSVVRLSAIPLQDHPFIYEHQFFA